MKFILNLTILAFIFISCGKKSETSNTGNSMEAKVNELADLKKEHSEITKRINTIEAEIIKLDPSKGVKPKLVSTVTLETEGFQHFINLQGIVNSNNVSYIAPRNGMGGYVKQLFVKAGQPVKKGQIILKLDDSVLKQAIESTKTQLVFAKNLYERTKALWDQKIGTEVQLLSSKNNVETLENQVKVQEEQLKTYVVYADQNGIADIVNIRVGELFSGMGLTGPQIQIVNNTDLSINVEIPENYSNEIKVGAKVMLEIPASNKTVETTISRLSQSINASSRGFTAECKIPAGANAKPNMAVTVKILNHSNSKAIVIPVNIVQSDEKGKYVYVMATKGDGNKVTHKKQVSIGQLYGEKIEILNGLESGDQLIVQGYQNLYEGQKIENNQN